MRFALPSLFTLHVAGAALCLVALVASITYRPLFWLVFPFANGAAIGLFVAQAAQIRLSMKREQFLARLPKTIQSLSHDEEKIVVSVTRNNGETVLVELPPDYNPRSDNGELLLRIVSPELFEGGEGDHWNRTIEEEG